MTSMTLAARSVRGSRDSSAPARRAGRPLWERRNELTKRLQRKDGTEPITYPLNWPTTSWNQYGHKYGRVCWPARAGTRYDPISLFTANSSNDIAAVQPVGIPGAYSLLSLRLTLFLRGDHEHPRARQIRHSHGPARPGRE